jgi:hypothetical protein
MMGYAGGSGISTVAMAKKRREGLMLCGGRIEGWY